MKRTHIKCPVLDLLARSFLATAAMLLTVSTTLAINYQSAVLGDAPQAYYRLGDLAPADVARNSGSLGTAGNGIHGPGVVHRVVGALVGGANAAAGYNDVEGAKHTYVPYNPSLNPPSDQPFTVEFWAKPSVEVTDAPGPCPLFNRVSSGNRSGWVFFQRSPATGWNCKFYNGSGSSVGIDLTGGSNARDTWSHVVVVWTGSDASMYVNGTLVAGPTAGVYNASTSAILSIGSYDDGVQNAFNGSVDEVALYHSALSPAQILLHYQNATNAVRSTPYEALVATDGAVEYLRLDETDPQVDTAANSGNLGAAADGLHFPGLSHNVAGALVGDSNTAATYSAIDTTSTDGGVPTIVPFNPALNPAGSFTVEAWLKPSIFAGANQPCALYNRITANAPFTHREGWDIFQLSGGWRFRMFNGDGNNTAFDINGGPMNVGGWQHVVAVYDASVPAAMLYVNGVLSQVSSQPVGSYVANTSAPFSIGGFPLYSNGHFENPFFGSIDEVAMYNTALSASQILAHYQNATNASRATPYQTLVGSANPVGYWRLDEPARNVAANVGKLGAAANGTYTSVTNPINNQVDFVYFSKPNSVAGPQAPAYAGFETDNQAAYMDGLSTYIELLNPAALNFSGPVSVEAWVLPNATQGSEAYIVAHGGNNDFSAEDVLRIEGNQYQGLSYDGTSHKAAAPIPAGDLGGGNWVHLVTTYDGASWNIYRNGVLAATQKDQRGLLRVRNANWAIGARGRWKFATGLERLFAGAVDEVAIYNRALSPRQIQAHYSIGVYAQEPLTLSRSGNNVILTWPAGTLQEATSVAGPYNGLAATSPYTTPATDAQKFYRVKLQ